MISLEMDDSRLFGDKRMNSAFPQLGHWGVHVKKNVSGEPREVQGFLVDDTADSLSDGAGINKSID